MSEKNGAIKITQYAPVIIPTLNRYDHFKQCIESLQKCTHADKTELIIGIDYPPSEKYVEGWKKIQKYSKSIKGFKKVTVFNHEQNLGSSKNIIFLRNYAYKSYDFYILSEDDNVFSPCFLDYINKSLEYYKNDRNVLAISGYMPPVTWETQTESTVVHMKEYPAWGISLRKEWLQDMEKNMPLKYLDYVCSHRKLLKKLKSHLRNLYQFIFWIKDNPSLNRRCDFTIANYLHISGKYVICPKTSLVRNMGNDGSGEHCERPEDDIYSTQKISTAKTFCLKDTLTQTEIKTLQEEFEYWMCEKSPSKFSDQQKKEVLKYYKVYMLLGYKPGNLFLKVSQSVKPFCCKLCPKFLKKIIKKILHRN